MGLWDGSGISWTICKQSAPHSRRITTLTPCSSRGKKTEESWRKWLAHNPGLPGRWSLIKMEMVCLIVWWGELRVLYVCRKMKRKSWSSVLRKVWMPRNANSASSFQWNKKHWSGQTNIDRGNHASLTVFTRYVTNTLHYVLGYITCRNGRTERAAIWGMVLGGQRNHVLDGVPDPPLEKGQFCGHLPADCKA